MLTDLENEVMSGLVVCRELGLVRGLTSVKEVRVSAMF